MSNLAGIVQRGFPTVFNPHGLVSGYTIGSIGDSLSSISIYQPTVLPTGSATPPQWLANTVYVANNTVVNNGLFYKCTVGGTSAASGGPTGVTNSIADNTVTWAYMPPLAMKSPREMIMWIEAWSLGELQWSQAQGYGGISQGLVKVLVQAGGSNYAATDTVTFTGGAKGTLTITGGVITACTVTDPGTFSGSNITPTIVTSTGSGAILTPVQAPAGTFGQVGNKTADMVASLSDFVNSSVDIFVVMIGTNDVVTNVAYSSIVANLKTIYETLLAAGKRVVAVPIFPRDSSVNTSAQNVTLQRTNRWIRAYYRKESWANPNGGNIFLADVSRYMTDGTSVTNSPIGAAAAGANAMTVDGVHQTQRGAQYLALSVINALAAIMGTLNTTSYRTGGLADGYSPTFNPSGNLLEGVSWQANTAYALGDHVSNDTAPVKVYVCITAGTSAGSGGPTGTTANITDNTVHWKFLYSQGLSVFAPTYDATPTAASGVVFTGNTPHGTLLKRINGSASGTVITTQENPWSDGQTGQRCSIAFSLGSGTNAEQWSFAVPNLFGTANIGIEASALAVNSFYVESEFEVTGANNFCGVSVGYTDNVANTGTFAMEIGRDKAQGSGSSFNEMNGSGEMLSAPNNGKRYLRTEPMILPANISANTQLIYYIFFNASGGAGSATVTIKFNYIAMRKALVG